MSVEQPLPDEWLEDLEEDILIQVEQDRLEALGFMKAEQHGSYERWEGGLLQDRLSFRDGRDNRLRTDRPVLKDFCTAYRWFSENCKNRSD